MVMRSAECAKRLNAEKMSNRIGRKITREIGLDGEAHAIVIISTMMLFLIVETTTVANTGADVPKTTIEAVIR